MLLVEDAVFGLGGAVDVVAGVGFGGHESLGEVFGEEELTDVGGVAGGVGLLLGVAANTDLEMDVVDAALIKAGKDGLEGDGTVDAGELNAAEEGEFVGGL